MMIRLLLIKSLFKTKKTIPSINKVKGKEIIGIKKWSLRI